MTGVTLASGETGGTLIVTEYPDLGQKKITCTEGYWVTTYKDGGNILSYYSSKCEYCLMDVEVYSVYRCISNEQDIIYKEAQRRAQEEIRAIIG